MWTGPYKDISPRTKEKVQNKKSRVRNRNREKLHDQYVAKKDKKPDMSKETKAMIRLTYNKY